jgi:hypothetical protein
VRLEALFWWWWTCAMIAYLEAPDRRKRRIRPAGPQPVRICWRDGQRSSHRLAGHVDCQSGVVRTIPHLRPALRWPDQVLGWVPRPPFFTMMVGIDA